MKYLITGLGNIGAKYDKTRHNVGFDVLDEIAGQAGVVFKTERYGDVAEVKHKGRIFILLKPSTFMNLSGKAVRYWSQFLSIPVERILIVTDDVALPFGKLRIRPKGSSGGHNGLKNIEILLGTNQYARLRFGVGGDFPKGQQIDYVLNTFSGDEQKELPDILKKATEMVFSFGTQGVQRTMNNFN